MGRLAADVEDCDRVRLGEIREEGGKKGGGGGGVERAVGKGIRC